MSMVYSEVRAQIDVIMAQIRQAQHDAILEERERCAKIAREYLCRDNGCLCTDSHAEALAEIIRSGK